MYLTTVCITYTIPGKLPLNINTTLTAESRLEMFGNRYSCHCECQKLITICKALFSMQPMLFARIISVNTSVGLLLAVFMRLVLIVLILQVINPIVVNGAVSDKILNNLRLTHIKDLQIS